MNTRLVRRPARVIGALALITVSAVAGMVALSTGGSHSAGSPSSLHHGTGSTTIRRRNLVQTDTQPGTISYADPQTVFNRLSGTITWLPQVGQVIKPGGTLYRVDGEPVMLMSGSTPAYRDLKASDGAGADIEQLNRNLVALGFDAVAIVVDDEWQPATTDGIEQLQQSLGEKETGSVSLGQIVFLPGDQLVATLNATVGATGGGSGRPATPADARTPLTATTEFVGLTVTTPTPPDTSTAPYASPTSPATSTRATKPHNPSAVTKSKIGSGGGPDGSSRSLAGLTALLRAEGARLQAATAALKAAKSSSTGGGRSSSSHNLSSRSASASSDAGGSATAILQTSSTRLLVRVDLPASSQREAVLGERVGVELPAGNKVGGTITAVSSVAQTSSSSADNATGGASSGGSGGAATPGSTVPVTITLKGHHHVAGLDQAAVSVNFEQAKAKHVLSVPVTALIVTSGGNYAVQQAAAPYALLPVTTGLFAAGYVQISGPGIHTGLPVTNSQG